MSFKFFCDVCDKEIEDICLDCGSTKTGLLLILSRYHSPKDVHEELKDRPNYHGIDLDTARKYIEIYKTTDDNPN